MHHHHHHYYYYCRHGYWNTLTSQYFNLRVSAISGQYRDVNIHAAKVTALYTPLIRMGVAAGFSVVVLLGSFWVLASVLYFCPWWLLVLFSPCNGAAHGMFRQ